MKKRFSCFIISAVMLVVTATPCFAALDTTNGSTISSSKEITDATILYDRAINNVNDVPQEILNEIISSSEVTINGVIQNYEPLVTTQLLETQTKTLDSTKSTTSKYASTIITDLEYVNGALLASDYQKTEQNNNSSDVRLYTTVYYTVDSYNAFTCIKLTQVSCSSKLLDSTCILKSTRVQGGYYGWNLMTNRVADYTSGIYYGTTSSASARFSCPPLEKTDGGFRWDVWGKGICVVNRGNQTWEVSHTVRESGIGTP